MSKYIDADKMIEYLETISQFIQCYSLPNTLNIDSIVEYVKKNCFENEDFENEDVVNVVRCKDCKYSRELDKYERRLYLDSCVGCTYHSKSYSSVIMQDCDFCSCGERKEEV